MIIRNNLTRDNKLKSGLNTSLNTIVNRKDSFEPNPQEYANSEYEGKNSANNSSRSYRQIKIRK